MFCLQRTSFPEKGWQPAKQRGWTPEGFRSGQRTGTEGTKGARKQGCEGTRFCPLNFRVQLAPDTAGEIFDYVGSTVQLYYYEFSQKEPEFGTEQDTGETEQQTRFSAPPRSTPQVCHFQSWKANSGFTKPATTPRIIKTKSKQTREESLERLLLLLDHQQHIRARC